MIHRTRRRSTRALAVVAAGLFALSPGADAQRVFISEEDNFSNSAYVPVSDQVKSDLFTGDLLAADGDWAGAIHAYQVILTNSADDAVEFGDRAWLCGAEAVRRRFLELPKAAHDRYQALFGETAASALRQALSTYDPHVVLAVADRYPFTASADRALRAAVGLGLERGDLAPVLRGALELRRRGSATADDEARLARALAVAGRTDDLRRHARRWLDDDREVAIGGQRRPLRAYVTELLSAAGVDARRVATVALSRGPLAVQPFAMLPPEEGRLGPRPEADPRRRGGVVLEWPPHRVASDGDGVWVGGQLGFYRIDSATAEAKPLIRFERQFAKTIQSTVANRAIHPVLDRGWLYGMLVQRFEYQRPLIELCQLAAFDLSADVTREVEFRVETTPSTASPELRGFVFEDPVVVDRDRLVVVGSRLDGTNTECRLFSLDKRTGEVGWSRQLASGARIGRYEYRNQPTDARRASPAPLCIADGIAYCVTNVGVVAAVDLYQGRVLWRFKYNRIRPDDPERFQEEAIFDTGGWNRCAPIVLGDSLVVAPEDSRFLYVLARDPSKEGFLRKQAPLFKGDRDALLGLDEDTATVIFSVRETVAATRDRVHISFERVTPAGIGRVFYTATFEVEEQLVGQPLLVGRTLFLPTTKRLCQLDLDQQGKIFADHPVPAPVAMSSELRFFGNLSRHDDVIYSVSPRYVVRIAPAP